MMDFSNRNQGANSNYQANTTNTQAYINSPQSSQGPNANYQANTTSTQAYTNSPQSSQGPNANYQANTTNTQAYTNSPQSSPNITSQPITSPASTPKEQAALSASEVVEFLIKDTPISVNELSLKKNAPQFWEKYVSPLNGASPVILEDIEPEEFQHFKKFIESEALDKTIRGDSSILKALLVAADKYLLDKLKKVCEPLLVATLTTENAVDLWILGADSGASTLQSAAFAFFLNKAEIENTEKFKAKICEIIDDEKRKKLAVQWYRAKTPKE